jgi:hypothetical protein
VPLTETHSLTGSDLQDFGGKTNRAFDAELLVLGPVDEIGGNYQLVISNS